MEGVMRFYPTEKHLLVRSEPTPKAGVLSVPAVKGYSFGRVVAGDSSYKDLFILYNRYSQSEVWQDGKVHHLVRKEDVIAKVQIEPDMPW